MTKRHGILGAGAAGRIHAEAVREAGAEYELVVYDPSLQARNSFLASFPGAIVVSSLSDLLDSGVRTASVATPHNTHYELTLELIRRDCHVLIEKPACLDVVSLGCLAQAAKAHGVLCATVLQHRLSDPVLWLKDRVMSGEMGSPYQIEAMLRCNRPDEYFLGSDWRGKKANEGGTVVVNQALHLIDLCCHLFGPAKVEAAVLRRGRHCMETEDAANAIFSFADGSLCSLSASVSTCVKWSAQLAVFGRSHFAILEIGFPDAVARTDMPVPDSLRPRADATRREYHEPHFRAVHRFLAASEEAVPSEDLRAFAPALETIERIYSSARVMELSTWNQG